MKIFQKTTSFLLALFLIFGMISFSLPVWATTYNSDGFWIDEYGILVDYRGESQEVKIPEGVLEIGSSAFRMNQVTKVEIPKGVKKIGSSAFEKSTLTEIIIPEGVTSIGNSAFQDCAQLVKVQIPKSVTKIGRDTFTRSAWLEQYPNDMVIINNMLVKYKNNDAVSVALPAGLKTINITAMSDLHNLTSISIPNTVTRIEEGAFSGSGIKNLVIPDSVTYIGLEVFQGCRSLVNITLSKNAPVLDYRLFYRCTSLQKIVIPEGVTQIKSYVFNECSSLSEVKLPNTLISIDGAFDDCYSLKSIVFPDKNMLISDEFYKTSNPKRDDFTGRPIYPELVIFGKKGSFADSYANSQNYSFCVIGENLIRLPSGSFLYNGRGYRGAVTMDTRTYTMAPGNIYDIGVKLSGNAPIKIRRMTSSRDGIASVQQLPNGNYRVTGLRPGTTYITYTIYDAESYKEITHASIKFEVKTGVKQHGVACRQTTYFN
ncbi:leucine-rich repeat domain-containing protein [Clostridium minihomine]|uniref:leucine-rich repeat domain-containing protein n=1 Tax=Clostridium minihomine TaxID=2045012 RepID=UPI0013EB9B27|nr:leucine-rich repeat domain-containing protein [Clostridium minihomine]